MPLQSCHRKAGRHEGPAVCHHNRAHAPEQRQPGRATACGCTGFMGHRRSWWPGRFRHRQASLEVQRPAPAATTPPDATLCLESVKLWERVSSCPEKCLLAVVCSVALGHACRHRHGEPFFTVQPATARRPEQAEHGLSCFIPDLGHACRCRPEEPLSSRQPAAGPAGRPGQPEPGLSPARQRRRADPESAARGEPPSGARQQPQWLRHVHCLWPGHWDSDGSGQWRWSEPEAGGSACALKAAGRGPEQAGGGRCCQQEACDTWRGSSSAKESICCHVVAVS